MSRKLGGCWTCKAVRMEVITEERALLLTDLDPCLLLYKVPYYNYVHMHGRHMILSLTRSVQWGQRRHMTRIQEHTLNFYASPKLVAFYYYHHFTSYSIY